MNFNYYTQDGHLMKNDEIMWRICCSSGILFNEPVSVIFRQNTGYNGTIEKINDNTLNFTSNFNLNPYAANHLHYFSKEEALIQLELRKNENT